jgi:hypothetical protein
MQEKKRNIPYNKIWYVICGLAAIIFVLWVVFWSPAAKEDANKPALPKISSTTPCDPNYTGACVPKIAPRSITCQQLWILAQSGDGRDIPAAKYGASQEFKIVGRDVYHLADPSGGDIACAVLGT